MESLLIGFHKELAELKSLIQFYELESELHDNFNFDNGSKENILLEKLSNQIKTFKLAKLQFNYNSIIISLYGSFERFIESCLVSYVERINKLINLYKDLPDVISKNHFTLSLTLINKIEQPKYSGPLRKEDIIKNLHLCINTNEAYQLNKDAFAQHSANFRLQVVEEAFSQVGINQISQKILKTESFRSYYIEKFGESESGFSTSTAFQTLNDLAEYRNYVAHGVSSEIIHNEILVEFLKFFVEYSKALIMVLTNDLLYRELEAKGIELGEITDVFDDGKIVCLMTNKIPLKKGDILIGKNKNSIIKSDVVSIRLNGQDIDTVDDKDNYEIGVKLKKNFKKTFKIFVLRN